MSLCTFCLEAVSTEPPPLDAGLDRVFTEVDDQQHHRNLDDLTNSSLSCVGCLHILQALRSSRVPEMQPSDHEQLDLHIRTNNSQTIKRGELLRDGILPKAVQIGDSSNFLSFAYLNEGSSSKLCRCSVKALQL